MIDETLVSMLYDILGVSVIEGRRLHVLGSVAGPAGSSTITMPDGGVWEVDHLDPAIPIRLEVDVDGADRSPLLIAAFGGDGALYLADEAISAPSDVFVGSTGSVQVESDSTMRRPSRDAYLNRMESRSRDDPDLMAGRIVVLNDMSMDTRAEPLVRIAATAELLLKAYGVSGGELLMPVRTRILEMANALVSDVDDDEVAILDARTATRFASALIRVSTTGRGSESPLMHLGRRAREFARRDTHRIALVPSMVHDPDEAGVPMGVRGDHPSNTPDVDTPAVLLPIAPVSTESFPAGTTEPVADYLELHRVTPAHLKVSVARHDVERWVRVIDDRDGVPLAQAPLGPYDLVEVADLVVPSDVLDENFRVEVFTPSDSCSGGLRPVELIRRAVVRGRDAARTTRVHGAASATSEWVECAGLWAAVGDSEREQLARAIAEGGPVAPIQPYLADEIADALERSER